MNTRGIRVGMDPLSEPEPSRPASVPEFGPVLRRAKGERAAGERAGGERAGGERADPSEVRAPEAQGSAAEREKETAPEREALPWLVWVLDVPRSEPTLDAATLEAAALPLDALEAEGADDSLEPPAGPLGHGRDALQAPALPGRLGAVRHAPRDGAADVGKPEPEEDVAGVDVAGVDVAGVDAAAGADVPSQHPESLDPGGRQRKEGGRSGSEAAAERALAALASRTTSAEAEEEDPRSGDEGEPTDLGGVSGSSEEIRGTDVGMTARALPAEPAAPLAPDRPAAPPSGPFARFIEANAPYELVRWTQVDDGRAQAILDHPELGPVRVELTMVDGEVQVQLLVQSAAGALSLQRAERDIRAILRQLGHRRGRVGVAVDREPQVPDFHRARDGRGSLVSTEA